MELITELEGYHDNAPLHLQFSIPSNLLYTVSNDTNRTLVIFEVGKSRRECKHVHSFSPLTNNQIFGLCIAEDTTENVVDEMLVFGKKVLKCLTVRRGQRGSRTSYLIKAKHITTKTKTTEKGYYSALYLPYNKGTFVVGAHSGAVYVLKQQKSSWSTLSALKSDTSPITCLTQCDNGFISATSQGNWTLWKRDTTSKFEKITTGSFAEIPHLHMSGAPRAIQFHEKTRNLFVGSRKNQIFQQSFDDGSGEVLIHGHSEAVSAVACHPKDNIYVTGGCDGKIICWNLSNFTPMLKTQIELDNQEEITCVEFISDGSFLVVGTTTSQVFLIDYEKFRIVQEIEIPPPQGKNTAEHLKIGCLCFNPAGNLLVCGHYDYNAYFFSFDKEEQTFEQWQHLANTRAPCTGIQFSEDGKLFRTLNSDFDVQHWSIDYEKQEVSHMEKNGEFYESTMAGRPLLAAWDTIGLQQPSFSHTDLRTC
eukprot:UN06588